MRIKDYFLIKIVQVIGIWFPYLKDEWKRLNTDDEDDYETISKFEDVDNIV